MQNKFVLLDKRKSKTSFQSYVVENHKPKSTSTESTKKKKLFLNQIIEDNNVNKKEIIKESVVNNLSNLSKEEENNTPLIQNFNNNIIQIKNTNTDYENDENENQYNIGRWTEDEHEQFIKGILEYGNEWKKVQQIIGTRSSTQARSHAQKFFLRIKKIIKSKGVSLSDKEKVIDIIKKNISPNNEIVILKSQEEQLIRALSSNFKYESDYSENFGNDDELGLEEDDNIKYKNESIDKISTKLRKMSNNILNISENNNSDCRKLSIGQKRKLTKNSDKIFNIEKDVSRKSSMDINYLRAQNVQDIKNTLNDNNKINNNDFNQDNNKSFDFCKKNDLPIINNYHDKDNSEKQNNNCVINNIINVTNNYSNNNFFCNLPNNDISNNNNNINYLLNNGNSNFLDYNIYNYNNNYNYDKNDFNFNPNYQNKNMINIPFHHLYNKTNNTNNYCDLENNNNTLNDPFSLDFAKYMDKNSNSGNERQLTINEEDEFIKINNNNNEDNHSYSY